MDTTRSDRSIDSSDWIHLPLAYPHRTLFGAHVLALADPKADYDQPYEPTAGPTTRSASGLAATLEIPVDLQDTIPLSRN